MAGDKFQMQEKQGRAAEISRRKRENMRAELIVAEMSSAVRVLGGDGSALEQNNRAARETRLSVTVVERLRWKKFKRVPADIADTVREALARRKEESLRRAKHELFIAQQTNAALIAHLETVDPAFHSETLNALRGTASGLWRDNDFQGGA